MECRLVIGSTNFARLTQLRNKLTSAFPTDATVTFSLATAAGVPVTGAQNLAMALVGGTTGPLTEYRATIPHTVALTPQTYVGTVLAIDTALNRRVFTLSCPAVNE